MSYYADMHTTIVESYAKALLWTELSSEDSTLADDGYTLDDIGSKLWEVLTKHVDEFLGKAPADLLEQMVPAAVGQDIALTRNRHGVGFWDRGMGELGVKLTRIAYHMGEFHLYPGYDDTLCGA